ncbi:hypothetical protein [Mechercharimyces sp. CAU 1602]|uniref:hypothetical protein n=1 Tax=Mechercharimyces sp. CAU 1602 TaxID=2973933 RepID=UPI0021636024|nr:hypothetical protein [Mechercharimyces sp. CAU 1602]MCS1351731.1 hypothetical protein [Mechercharimyces sp. CAU 1602]
MIGLNRRSLSLKPHPTSSNPLFNYASKLLSDGLILAGITGLGYFSAYLSDLAYKSYFGIPSMFIDIGINTVILSISILVICFLILIIAIDSPFMQKYGRHLFPFLLITAIGILLATKMNFTFSWAKFPFILGVYLTYLFAAWFLFMLVYSRRLKAAMITFALIVVSISYSSGSIIAQNQQEYLVTLSPSPHVVIAYYGDSLILAPINLDSGEISNSYKFIDQKAAFDEALSFTSMEVGPLTIER